MPSKNSQKRYVENGYYHLYNRGINKQVIFREAIDYKLFLSLLKLYLIPQKQALEYIKKITPHTPNRVPINLADQMKIICFCLLPNHFHLLIKQVNKNAITKLMRAVLVKYSMYFNKKYNRTGHLFEGVYKGILIGNNHYLLHLTRYIHQNPDQKNLNNCAKYPYSSYSWYLDGKQTEWFDPFPVLNFFQYRPNFVPKDSLSYQDFMSKNITDYSDNIKALFLES